MGFCHILNLYKEQDILLFKECYALEKVHGTSAHVRYALGVLTFFGGDEKPLKFKALFNEELLKDKLSGFADVTIFGEAYGGTQQRMSGTYGPELKFIAFDVKIDNTWLDVPAAERFVTGLGIEFVPYDRIRTENDLIDAQRDRPSVVAIRRGMGDNHPREGVVLRPLIELQKGTGERVIAKHKIEKFSERATNQKIDDPNKLIVLGDATKIADEWVTPMRLEHVLQKIASPDSLKSARLVLDAMVEDVYREAKGEIVESPEAKAAINKKTLLLFKEHLEKRHA